MCIAHVLKSNQSKLFIVSLAFFHETQQKVLTIALIVNFSWQKKHQLSTWGPLLEALSWRPAKYLLGRT